MLMEVGVSVGICAPGAFVFNLILTKVAIEIELGRTGKHKKKLKGVGNNSPASEQVVASEQAIR